MPRTKKKTTTRKTNSKTKTKPRQTKKKKQQKTDSSIRYIIAIVIVIISILGIFQLGLVGRMIDSFFNYLFGASRYLTYILVSLITIYIAMQRHFPKTRRTFGLILLQFVLLIVSQLIYYFSKGEVAKREPILSYVYKSYEHTYRLLFIKIICTFNLYCWDYHCDFDFTDIKLYPIIKITS